MLPSEEECSLFKFLYNKTISILITLYSKAHKFFYNLYISLSESAFPTNELACVGIVQKNIEEERNHEIKFKKFSQTEKYLLK